jgi:hypothetical protein
MCYALDGEKRRLKRMIGLKRRWKIYLAILAILVITGTSFAYTYLTATQQISVNVAGDIATVEASGSPSWSGIAGQQAGTLPETTLFKITPLASYTGNLLVTVYLTNTGELVNVYQHLNMKMEIVDNDGNKIGRIEYLTLSNGKVSFVMTYGAGWNSPYYVKITGGSFNTLKGTAGPGESFSPSFYCEVRQY